jgi:hypothetical protein
MAFDAEKFTNDLGEIVDHFDHRQDHLTHRESLNDLDRIQRILDDAYSELERRQQEHRPQSTPLGVGAGTAGFFQQKKGRS